jgi:VanZ family protein
MKISPTVWRWSFWALVLVTLLLSLVPAEQVPSALHFWDKAQHALGFAGLVFLGLMAYPNRIRLLLLSLLLLGAGIEVAQWLTGWRQGDWQDWLADCAGLVLGSIAWRLIRWCIFPVNK